MTYTSHINQQSAANRTTSTRSGQQDLASRHESRPALGLAMPHTKEGLGRQYLHPYYQIILGLVLLSPIVASCAGTSFTDPNQIIVRRDEDPYNFAAAEHEADQICASRGRRAQFVFWENHAGGVGPSSDLPNAIFNCVPGASTAPRSP
jgi:hypothetical protein